MPRHRRYTLDDPVKLLETAFEEALALLSLLDPTEPPGEACASQSPSQTISDRGKRFLDHLSWLCDPLSRGRTVAGIGVEESQDGSKFWIASNNGCKRPVKRHLQWLLRILEKLVDGRMTTDAVRNQIFERSIELSSERVKNYVTQLTKVESHCFQLQQTCEKGIYSPRYCCRRIILYRSRVVASCGRHIGREREPSNTVYAGLRV
jgi:hypothetical protein